MADDMTGKLMEIINNPEMMKKLSDTIKGDAGSISVPSQNDEITAKAQSIMNTLRSNDDKRINLLNAIRPYMRESRVSGIDKAIQMLKITKLAEIFKNEE